MKNLEFSTILRAALLTLLLSLASGFAFAGNGHQTKPDLAKKEENVRKQQGQRITPEKKKIAAEKLKAERLRLYNSHNSFIRTRFSSKSLTFSFLNSSLNVRLYLLST